MELHITFTSGIFLSETNEIKSTLHMISLKLIFRQNFWQMKKILHCQIDI